MKESLGFTGVLFALFAAMHVFIAFQHWNRPGAWAGKS